MICSDCGSPLCEYQVEGIIERICWNCGHYESTSQAYKEHPELFKNMIRNKPLYFIERFIHFKVSDKFLQRKKSDEDFTEPLNL